LVVAGPAGQGVDGLVLAVVQDVVAVPAVEAVRTLAAPELVVIRAAFQRVVPAVAAEHVLAVVAGQPVVPGVPPDGVPAPAARDPVVALFTPEGVGAARPVHHVVPVPAENPLARRPARDRVVAVERVDNPVQQGAAERDHVAEV
jgi:hypothetical protein